MVKKLSSYINFLDERKITFVTSEKFKTINFPYLVNMVFHAKENTILLFFLELKDQIL